MKKQILTERFQQLAGITPLYEIEREYNPEFRALSDAWKEAKENAGPPKMVSNDFPSAIIQFDGRTFDLEFEQGDSNDRMEYSTNYGFEAKQDGYEFGVGVWMGAGDTVEEIEWDEMDAESPELIEKRLAVWRFPKENRYLNA